MRVPAERRVSRLAAATVLATSMACATAQQPDIALDADDVGGVVTSAKGPEAGVWVIAETTDLPTRLIKSVVTDDQGRYLLPDLPSANYDVFVRGYGLVDSAKVKAKPGTRLDLEALIAPDAKAAAQYYPAASWLSLLEIPKGPKSEQEVVAEVKFCLQCHQLGNKYTREIPKEHGTFASSLDAWDHRVKTGASGGMMSTSFQRLGPQRNMFADWSDRISKGALPAAPPRPSGAERNVVITQWDWAWPTGTRADSVATSEDNPQVNANGRLYGVYTTEGKMAWLDPNEHTVGAIDTGVSGLRSLAMDNQGRPWFPAGRPADAKPLEFCKSPNNKYVKYFPVSGRGREVVTYDPKTQQITHIPVCVGGDHNYYVGKEPDAPIYFGSGNTLNWFSTATWDKTQNAEASQGWCPTVLDTNGDGKITAWTEPNQPLDPTKDRRINLSCYSIQASSLDNSLWCTGIGETDNQLVRIERGTNPPETCKAEIYRPPASSSKTPFFKTGGTTVDSNGVAWTGWRGSDQLTSFDRRKCKTTTARDDKGDQCPEGWTVHQMTRPLLKGTSYPAHAEMQYLMQMDRHNTLGLGANAVIAGPVNSDSLQVFVQQTGEFLDLVVPYPMGFFSRSSQGRIDDPSKGWKGRGVWSNGSTYTPHHAEGGNAVLGPAAGPKPKAVKFQMRPDPLAK